MARQTATVDIQARLGQFLSSMAAVNNAYKRQQNSVSAINNEAKRLGSTMTAAQSKAVAAANKSAQASSRAFQQFGKRSAEELRAIRDIIIAEARRGEVLSRIQLAETVQKTASIRLTTAQLLATSGLVKSGGELLDLTNRLTTAQGRLASASAGGVGGGGGLINLSGIFKAASNAGRGFLGVLGGIGGAINSLLSPLRHMVAEFSPRRWFDVAAGVLIRDVIFGVARAAKEAAGAVAGFAANLQTLQVRFETLLSREIRTVDKTISFSDSMAKAIPMAKGLLEWVKQLSLIVPIDATDISNTLAFAQAMGFATGEAQGLTKAVLTYTAALGLGSEVSERIILNFGQMKLAGKVTATEMRDLARGAFFPLDLVLEESAKLLGKTSESMLELKEEAAEGSIPIDVFFKAFQNVVERDLPGAVERMGKTLQGAFTRLKNFFKVVWGGDILGPTLARMGEQLSNFVDKLNDPALRERAMVLGETLSRGFLVIGDAIERGLLPALQSLASALGLSLPNATTLAEKFAFLSIVISRAIYWISGFIKTVASNIQAPLSQIATNSFKWGANIVTSLAKGMASAFTAIVNVLAALGRLIASWLAPGSPPKILPDLQKWGAEAMSIYLKGWGQADFSLFNDVADKIEAFLRSIPGGIGTDNKGLIPRILGSRAAIVDAINGIREGSITVTQAIERIMKASRGVTSEFRRYIEALIKVASAQKNVADAEKAVEAAQAAHEAAAKRVAEAELVVQQISDKYSKILDELNDQLHAVTEEFEDQTRLEKINAALASGLLTDEEKRRLEMEKRAIEIRAQIRATEEQRDAELEGAEAVVAAREEEEAAAQAALDLAEQQRQAAEDQLAMLEEELAAAEGVIDFQIKQNELLQEQLSLLESLAKALSGTGAGAGGGGLLGDLSEAILGAFDEEAIRKKVDEIFANMSKAVNDRMAEVASIFRIWWEDIFGPRSDFQRAINNLEIEWDRAWKAIKENPFLKAIGTVVGDVLRLIGQAWEELKTKAGEAFETLFGDLEIHLPKVTDLAWLLYIPVALVAALVVGTLLSVYVLIVGLTAAYETATKIVDGLRETIQLLSDEWNSLKEEFTVKKFFEFLYDLDAEFRKYFSLGGFLLNVVGEFVKNFLDLLNEIYDKAIRNSIIPDMLGDMEKAFSDSLDAVLTTTYTWVGDMVTQITALGTSMQYLFTVYLTIVYNLWMAAWSALADYTKTVVIPAIKTDLLSALSELSTFISRTLYPTVVDLRTKGFMPLATFISGTLSVTFQTFRTGPMKKLADDLESDLVTAADDATDAMEDLKSGFNHSASAASGLIGKINQLINALKKLNQIDNSDYIPGSPVPFAEGLKRINQEAAVLAGNGLSALTRAVSALPGSIATDLTSVSSLISPSVVAAPVTGGGSIDRSINIEINPTYRNVQSEASLYYDVVAALAAARS